MGLALRVSDLGLALGDVVAGTMGTRVHQRGSIMSAQDAYWSDVSDHGLPPPREDDGK